jgi:hypothetical protein
MSQHWQMNTTVLAQAPGPDYHETNVQAIPYDSDTSVSAATVAADWATTWAKTLKPLSSKQGSGSGSSSNSGSNSNTGSSGNSGNQNQSKDKSSTSSKFGGAIAGIVIGVLGGVALVAAAVFFLMRRRRSPSQRRLSSTGVSLQNQSHSPHAELDAFSVAGEAKPAYEIESKPLTELPSQQRAFELPGDSLLAEKPAN